jgi:hypothetical protein
MGSQAMAQEDSKKCGEALENDYYDGKDTFHVVSTLPITSNGIDTFI